MRAATVVAGASAVATVVFYVAWIVAAADDYDRGLQHFSALAFGALGLVAMSVFVVSVGFVIAQWARRRL